MNQRQLIVIAGAAVVGLGMVAYAFVAGSHPTITQSVPVTRMNLVQEVKTTGVVQGSEDVELSFQTSGNIAAVNATVGQTVQQGQTIAALDTSTLQAQLTASEAALKIQQLKLEGMSNDTTVGSDIQTTIANSRNALIDKLTDGYVKVDTALSTYTDTLFSNPTTYPQFGVNVSQAGSTYTISTDASMQFQINSERNQLNSLMTEWNTLNQNLSTDTGITAAEQKAQETFVAAQKLLADISTALNATSGSDATFQTLIGTYKVSIATARTTVDTGLTNLRTAEQTYATSQSPASNYSQQLQQASVQSAQAQVNAIIASINQAIIKAPFTGIITEQNAKVGQIASAGTPLVHLISKDKLQVETYVSQADIGKISVGMPATITLDPYGPDTSWNATVVSVASGQSTINTVTGYKIILQFNDADPRIKSGMGANVHFEISQKSDVLALPEQAIIRKESIDYVIVDNNGTQTEREVTTGITGINGYVEIVSGLQAGDHIITFTTK